MDDLEYQHNYSATHQTDIDERIQKAKKVIAVLEDFLQGDLDKTVLDISCSVGIFANALSEKFTQVIGIDIDSGAVKKASAGFQKSNLEFLTGDVMDLDFADGSIDIVIAAATYEHVPDPERMMSEIYRVLRPGGVCYFTGANRLTLMEPHYRLPFLSLLPKPLSHRYLKLLKRGSYYYEKLMFLPGLKKLVAKFEIRDYTLEVIRHPEKYHLEEMVKNGSLKQKLALALLSKAYWICPTYIWLLTKRP